METGAKLREKLSERIKNWFNEKGTLIQELGDKGSFKEMFDETKLVCRKWCPQLTELVSKDGHVLGKKEEMLER